MLCEKPIEDWQNDRLNRRAFASNLAKRINEYRYQECLTIGIIGKWGTGKTSIINMMKNEINNTNVEVLEFNPWYFSERKQLISDYFAVLANVVEDYDMNVPKKKLAEDLLLYSKILKPLGLISPLTPIIDVLVKGATEGSEILTQVIKNNENNLTDIKKRINEQLAQYDKKIVVIIDEIDRLENEEIKKVFQLVRALGDFNNIIYILSFDNLIVEKIVEKEYLNKIINVPIHVPEVPVERVNQIFVEEIDKIIFNHGDEINTKYWDQVYETIFKNAFGNIRELNRYINVIRFNAGVIAKELSIIDYLVITYFQIFDEEAYDYIRSNKEKILNKKINIDECLMEMPVLSKNIKLKNLIEIVFRGFISRRGINNPRYFNAYFSYQLEEGVLGVEQINKYISVFTKDSVYEVLNILESINDILNNIEEIGEMLIGDKLYWYIEVLLTKVSTYPIKDKNSIKKSDQGRIFDAVSILIAKGKMPTMIREIFNNIEFGSNIGLEELIEWAIKVIRLNNSSIDIEGRGILRRKIEQYIGLWEFKDVVRHIKGLKEVGINVRQYIECNISSTDGLLIYLESLVVFVREHYIEIYDEEGNPMDVEVAVEEAIILDNITQYIDYGYVKSKIMEYNLKQYNSEIVNMFEHARPYEEVFEQELQMEAWSRDIDS